ncbi:hypothetical protein [Nonomuraea guangzhouensis]|uniref:DUF732 domain-containing protein n=1 Tax=Nonomuraea guangzhouensis TaxID=1291555 RepID=A0ABW4GQF1_9ACTN|nr:hypothetical protein [Nonomuraea guangzhouensis]
MNIPRAAHRLALGMGVVILCASFSACGTSGTAASQTAAADAGQDSSPTTATSKKKTPRPSPRGGVTKAALLKKMKSEPDVGDLSESVMSCLAELALEYGDGDDLKRYIEGSISDEKIKGLTPSNKPYWKATDKCLK